MITDMAAMGTHHIDFPQSKQKNLIAMASILSIDLF